MKQNLRYLFTLVVFAIVFTACEGDSKTPTTNPPTIRDFELGSDHNSADNGQAYAGRDFHMAAEILASEKIATIEVIISKDEEKPTTGWKYNLYKGYSGQINASFHEHIIVPKTAEIGDYKLLFKVTDTKSKTAEIKRNLKVLPRPKI